MVPIQRWQLRPVALDRGALALVVDNDGHGHRRGPEIRAEELRDAPRQHPGDVLVAAVLVTEPRDVALVKSEQHSRFVRRDMIGIGQSHGQERRRGLRLFEDARQHFGDRRGRRPRFGRKVLIIDEVQPDRARAEHCHRGAVFLAA